ncbi:putative acyl-CoA dehydrogenase 6 [Acipenser ruthenus]|uniref:Putative acyl-CoA dehydrogenase 6 n=1 Tax=Acipenser ruthenus TaxID=7906 RepID=A0A444UAR7_ACIRT|nr:putative acyl-CoA dehydrogenase 6 [Acipenser ruthenus]
MAEDLGAEGVNSNDNEPPGTQEDREVVRETTGIAWAEAGEPASKKISATVGVGEQAELGAQIIDKEINPFIDKWEEAELFPAHRIFKILGSSGFLGVNKPTELIRYGSAELKKEFLQPTIAGDKVVCLGVSEVGAGSDVASIKTKAVRKGDDYIINGGKMWTTNGTQADWMCLLANTSDGPPHRNKSLICLPMNLPGIHVTRKISKIGMKSSDTAEIFFDDVRVPCKNLIGEEGMGFTYQMLQFQEERLWGVANILTPMQTVIQETIEYTRHRKIFNQPILHNQTVHFRLAELETEVELLRSLLYRSTAMYVNGTDVTKLASMAKLKAGRLARELSDSCLQFWGGMGFTSDVFVSRFYRDSRLMSIGAGADEVMLSIICKYMETLPGKK